MAALLGILGFIFGTIIGSFLNVVILRMKTGKGVDGRSACMSCGKTLAWYELVPVASYLIQRGTCRTCREKISSQYVIVELATGVIFAGAVASLAHLFITEPVSFVLQSGWWFAIISVSMVISAYDLKHKLIDVTALAVFAVLCVIGGLYDAANIGLLQHLFGGVIVPLPFLALWAVSRGRLIGFGDIEIMACIGFLFGVVSGFSAVTSAFWIGTLAAVAAVIRHRRKTGDAFDRQIPFAPFLLGSIYIVGILHIDIFAWILGMR